MFDALYVGATGMRGQQLQIDTIAHNLANVNTIGYRRAVTSFSEVSAALSASDLGALASVNSGLSGRGAGALALNSLSTLAGELRATGEPLDLAIDGAGFIEVVRADGTPAYTRAGKLRINDDGMLGLPDGSVIAAQIAIPSDAIQIQLAADGRVSVVTPSDPAPVEVGQLDLVTFANPSALRAVGDNLYVASDATGEAQVAAAGEQGLGLFRQGYLESSNVQLADELVTLMIAQRAFELNARVVQAADQMMSITNGLYR